MEEILKLLLVDDDAVDRLAVRRALQTARVATDIVEIDRFADAIQKLQEHTYDCVVLDYRLPDGDGLSLVNQVRQMGLSVPLIVLTGQGDEEVAVELMKAGAHDYLSKQKLSPGSLSRSLLTAVRVSRAEQQATEATKRLRESEERYRLVLEGSNDGVWDWYICQNEVFCNDRLFEIIGIARDQLGTAYDAFYRLIHPDDRLRILRAIALHLERGDPFDVEFQLWHSSGNYRYCTSRGKALRDPNGNLFRMSGIISDITARKQAEAEVSKLNRDLERRVTELQTLLDVIPIGITIAEDANCHRIRANPTYASMVGIAPDSNASIDPASRDPAVYKIIRHGKELSPPELPMQTATALRRPVLDVELDILRADGKVVNTISYTTPLFDEQGNPRGCVGAFLDITELKRTEAAQRFLVEASSVLSTSLDYQTILDNIANLAVPTLADFCFFDVLNHRGQLQRLSCKHSDPERQDWFRQSQQFTPPLTLLSNPIAQCVQTGQSVFIPQVTPDWMQAAAVNSQHLQFMRDLELNAVIAVPLIVHDRKLGVLTFCRSQASQRHYTPADMQLAEDLATRAALAMDNAQLYRTTQEAEQNLRQALVILGQHQQQLRTLQRLTDLLNQNLTNLPELLQVMVGAICNAIPNAEFGLIVLQNPYTGLLERTAATGTDADRFQVDDSFAPGEGLLGELFLAGGSRLIQSHADVFSSPTPSPTASGDLPPSLCAVAIESARGGRLGVLAIGNWSAAAAFDDDNLQLLIAFSEQAAIALTNAQLISDLEEREERLAVQNQILGEQNQALEQQRQQIQLQNIRLREAAQLKSQFMATMSHELRTPMNAVIGFSQLLLRQDQLTPKQRDMIGRILSNGQHLLALINDILDLSKIEAGRLELSVDNLNLSQLITRTIAELRSLADQKGLTLHVNLTLANPLICNDSTRLRQVLVNLLSNAIKFTESGSVRVIVNEVDTDTIALIVQDTGIGIAAMHLEHIFEAFHQIDQTLAKRFSGTGLGLAITDLLVRKMGGRITVESELNVGSTFRVEFPRRVELYETPGRLV